jgi:hypothetical protein
LATEIKRNVNDVLFEDFNLLNKDDLDDNSGIINQMDIELAKRCLLENLAELENLT